MQLVCLGTAEKNVAFLGVRPMLLSTEGLPVLPTCIFHEVQVDEIFKNTLTEAEQKMLCYIEL